MKRCKSCGHPYHQARVLINEWKPVANRPDHFTIDVYKATLTDCVIAKCMCGDGLVRDTYERDHK